MKKQTKVLQQSAVGPQGKKSAPTKSPLLLNTQGIQFRDQSKGHQAISPMITNFGQYGAGQDQSEQYVSEHILQNPNSNSMPQLQKFQAQRGSGNQININAERTLQTNYQQQFQSTNSSQAHLYAVQPLTLLSPTGQVANFHQNLRNDQLAYPGTNQNMGLQSNSLKQMAAMRTHSATGQYSHPKTATNMGGVSHLTSVNYPQRPASNLSNSHSRFGNSQLQDMSAYAMGTQQNQVFLPLSKTSRHNTKFFKQNLNLGSTKTNPNNSRGQTSLTQTGNQQNTQQWQARLSESQTPGAYAGQLPSYHVNSNPNLHGQAMSMNPQIKQNNQYEPSVGHSSAGHSHPPSIGNMLMRSANLSKPQVVKKLGKPQTATVQQASKGALIQQKKSRQTAEDRVQGGSHHNQTKETKPKQSIPGHQANAIAQKSRSAFANKNGPVQRLEEIGKTKSNARQLVDDQISSKFVHMKEGQQSSKAHPLIQKKKVDQNGDDFSEHSQLANNIHIGSQEKLEPASNKGTNFENRQATCCGKQQRSSKGSMDSSLLTVTILQAKLNVDLSSIFQKMQVYSQIKLKTFVSVRQNTSFDQEEDKGVQRTEDVQITSETSNENIQCSKIGKSEQNHNNIKSFDGKKKSNEGKDQASLFSEIEKKTKNVPGTNPKWFEPFIFTLESLPDKKRCSYYLLEIGVFSSNYLVSDSCIGRAFLKFEGSHSETGTISNWLNLKNEKQQNTGQIFVSVNKEQIMTADQRMQTQELSDKKKPVRMYQHIVTNTEECQAVNGEPDDEEIEHQVQTNDQNYSENNKVYNQEETNYEVDEAQDSPIDDVQLESQHLQTEDGNMADQYHSYMYENPVNNFMHEQAYLNAPLNQVSYPQRQHYIDGSSEAQNDDEELEQDGQGYNSQIVMGQPQLRQYSLDQQQSHFMNVAPPGYGQTQQQHWEGVPGLDHHSIDNNLQEDDYDDQDENQLQQCNGLQFLEAERATFDLGMRQNSRSQLQVRPNMQPLSLSAKNNQKRQQQLVFNNKRQTEYQRQLAPPNNKKLVGFQHKESLPARSVGVDPNFNYQNLRPRSYQSTHNASQKRNNVMFQQQQHQYNHDQNGMVVQNLHQLPMTNVPQQYVRLNNFVQPDIDEEHDGEDENHLQIYGQEQNQHYGIEQESEADSQNEDGEDTSAHLNTNHQQQQQLEYGEEDDGESADQHTYYTSAINDQRNAQTSQNQQILFQMQQQNVADELIDLHKDIMEENARLRNDVTRLDQMYKQIEERSQKNKQDKANNKKMKQSLKQKNHMLRIEAEKLDYKRQQLEKENIKLNKQWQKIRKMKKSIEEACQVSQNLVKSEIFQKLKYEASLSANNGSQQQMHDNSDDWMIALQAHEFIQNFKQLSGLLSEVNTLTILKGNGSSGDNLNSKLVSNNQTTQNYHKTNISQTSLATSCAISSNLNLGSKNQKRIDRNNTADKSNKFMSEDTSICGDRNMLAGIDQSPIKMAPQDEDSKNNYSRILEEKQTLTRQQPDHSNIQANKDNNYWTNSSVREITGQGQSLKIGQGQDQPHQAMQQNNLQTPVLTQHNEGNGDDSLEEQSQVRPSSSVSTSVPVGVKSNMQASDWSLPTTKTKPALDTSHNGNQQPKQVQQQSIFKETVDLSSEIVPLSQSVNNSNQTQRQVDLQLDQQQQEYREHLDVNLSDVAVLNRKPSYQENRNSDTRDGLYVDQNLANSTAKNGGYQKNDSQHIKEQEKKYHQLIDKVSKELNDIKQIKQDLLVFTQEAAYQNSQIRYKQSQEDTKSQNHSNGIGEYSSLSNNQQITSQTEQLNNLELEQLRFLQDQSRNPDALLVQNQTNESCDDVENYTWQSMQQNAQLMQSSKVQRSIQDPIQLGHELPHNFQTQQSKQSLHQSASSQIPLQEQFGAEEEEEPEFKFDPDFLAKINANMAQNDRVFEARNMRNQDVDDTPHSQMAFSNQLFMADDEEEAYGEEMQQTVQGEQQLIDGELRVRSCQVDGLYNERASFISDEDGQNSRGNEMLDQDGHSLMVSPNTDQFQDELMLQSPPNQAKMGRPNVPLDLKFLQQLQQQQPQINKQNGTNSSGGAAPATLSARQGVVQTDYQTPGQRSQSNVMLNGSQQQSSNATVRLANQEIKARPAEPDCKVLTTAHQVSSNSLQTGSVVLPQQKHGQPESASLAHDTNENGQMCLQQQEGQPIFEDEITRLINEQYQMEGDMKDVSDEYDEEGNLRDQRKRALYAIRHVKTETNF